MTQEPSPVVTGGTVPGAGAEPAPARGARRSIVGIVLRA